MTGVREATPLITQPIAPPILEPEPPAVRRSSPRPSRLSLLVLFVGAVATVLLSSTTRIVANNNEQRLLALEVRQAGAIIQVLLPAIQTPIASAAAIAESSNGAAADFRSYAATYVGAKQAFVSMSLLRITRGSPHLIARVGVAPKLAASSSQATQFLSAPSRARELGVLGLLTGATPRLGYTYTSAVTGPRYVVYAESAVPADHRVQISKSSPFHDLHFALYLGTRVSSRSLMQTNVNQLPLSGRTARAVLPFGSASITIVGSSGTTLTGQFAGSRWWTIAVFGGLVTLAAGLMTDRLVKRRRRAEGLADDVEILLRGQRSIAQTLQRALRPGAMPTVAGLEIAARYLPGVNGIEIGGDWYDVVPVDEHHFYFVMGDVSGRGLGAGSVMASLHFAIRGYISEGHDPATVLELLGRLLDLRRDKHFATVLCGYADSRHHEVTIANAGHLPPLVVGGRGTGFVAVDVGPPIGVTTQPVYRTVTLQMDAGSTLLAYTDGLVERRGETLDEGMQRLRAAAKPNNDLDAMLSAIVATLTPDGSDDTALLGLRWT